MVERLSDDEIAALNAELDRRAAAYARIGGTCWYCGPLRGEAPITEHVTPLSRGGTDTYNNTVVACRSCNGRKSYLTLEEFRTRVAHRNGVPRETVIFYGEVPGREFLAPELDPPAPDAPDTREEIHARARRIGKALGL